MLITLKFPERWKAERPDESLIEPWEVIDGDCRKVTVKEAKQLATTLFMRGITHHEPHNATTVWVLVEFADANNAMLWLQTNGDGCIEVQLCPSNERH